MGMQTFQTLVRGQRHHVAEVLQLYGTFPQCEAKSATEQDWMHALMTDLADVAEQCRFDLSDPVVNTCLRRQLARVVAVCQAWDKQLTEA